MNNSAERRVPTPNDNDSAFDAYIEKLIRSVEDDDDDESQHEDDLPANDLLPVSEKDHDELKGGSDILDSTEDKSSPTVEALPPTTVPTASKATKKKKSKRKKGRKNGHTEQANKIISESIPSETQDKNLESKADRPSRITSKYATSETPLSSAAESKSELKETVGSTVPESANADQKPNPSSPRHRIPPPNGLYRFLLSKGLIGRLLVMLFILISELISTLLPNIAKALRAILPNSNLVYKASSTGRPSTKKKKSEITREADQAALEQLQQAGKEGGKYRLIVSSVFMKRHEIGPYAAEHSEASVEQNEDVNHSINDQETKVEEDDDASWIIQALSNEKEDDEHEEKEENSRMHRPELASSKRRNSAKASAQRESRVRAAIKIPQKKLKKSNPFGSKLLGKFASADNRFSRNLLGAYPGDAVPLEEAANAAGLPELAQRYGWGDWAHEGESRRRKRRRKANSSNGLDFGFDFGGSMGGMDDLDDQPFPEVTAIRRSRRFTTQSSHDEELSPDEVGNPLDLGDQLLSDQETSATDLMDTYRSASKRVRPATELLSERRKLQNDNPAR